MPELPEVETVKNQLAPKITGRTITDVTLLWEKMVKGQDPAEFLRLVKGHKILELGRHGKYLIVHLSSGNKMIIHLKMTGSLLLGKKGDEVPQYTRAVIHLDDGQEIFFRDPRKFGVLKLLKNTAEIDAKLGPTPSRRSEKVGPPIPVLSREKINRSEPLGLCHQLVRRAFTWASSRLERSSWHRRRELHGRTPC